jgi:hypothetical protein
MARKRYRPEEIVGKLRQDSAMAVRHGTGERYVGRAMTEPTPAWSKFAP